MLSLQRIECILVDIVSTEDEFLLEMCSGRAAWTVIPNNVSSIDLEEITVRIENEGWVCTLRNRLCCTFTGEADITLYPSGKLLVKSGNRDVAEKIAKHHVQVWLSNSKAHNEVQ